MNISQIKAHKLEDRMLIFALDCIALTKSFGGSAENRVITDQLVRCSSSIGANYTEANNAVSKLDFRNKMYLSKKEAAESRYWLRLAQGLHPELSIEQLINESTELLLILQSSVNTLRNSK